jgi:hypothetical protein
MMGETIEDGGTKVKELLKWKSPCFVGAGIAGRLSTPIYSRMVVWYRTTILMEYWVFLYENSLMQTWYNKFPLAMYRVT